MAPENLFDLGMIAQEPGLKGTGFIARLFLPQGTTQEQAERLASSLNSDPRINAEFMILRTQIEPQSSKLSPSGH